jgi:hypothetical protein
MTSTEQKVSSNGKDVKVSPRTETLIGEIKNLWSTTQNNYMKMGEHFSHLRAETETYQKNDKTGISYSEAVRRTGVPRSTAEFHRGLYETCADYSIATAVFLALQDHGVNLAKERFESALEMKELRTVNVADHEAVSNLADHIKKACPADKGEKASLMTQIGRLQADAKGYFSELAKLPAEDKATVKQKADLDFYKKEHRKAEKKLLETQLTVIEQLVNVFGVVDVSDSFEEQPELRDNLWTFVVKAGEQLASAFTTKKPTGKVTRKEK